MSKRDILQEATFGQRVAEEETNELGFYFVETDQWHRIYAGEVDVVYGPKGSGKSAIYTLLLSRADALFDRGILIAAAEDPRGAPVFKDLVADPPASETEFRHLWKLYFLSLVGRIFREYGIPRDLAHQVTDPLEIAGLLSPEKSLRGVLRSVVDYVRRYMRAETVEGGIEIDPNTGTPKGLSGKITLREPTSAQKALGLISADRLLELANEALEKSAFQIWLVLDRLDVAFAESSQLEGNALRALFRVYLDFAAYNCLHLKIFLRNDIWQRITTEGFREASHVTRYVNITWNKESLLNLVIRRVLRNEAIRKYYGVSAELVLQSTQEQYNLFYRLFPPQVKGGAKKPTTFDWMLSRTRDGLGQTAPRELIHLLSSAREMQLKKLELGNPEPSSDALFDSSALREGLAQVSEVRLVQTLYAEYPELREWLQKLEGAKTQQVPKTLAEVWRVDMDKALNVANRLAEIGFFERRVGAPPVFWVPFLYREALRMVQGSAIPGQDDEDRLEADF